MPAAQGISFAYKARLPGRRVGALAAAFGVDGRRTAAGRLFARSHACRAKSGRQEVPKPWVLRFFSRGYDGAWGCFFLLSDSVALGCFVACRHVASYRTLPSAQASCGGGGKKLGWLVAIPIALLCRKHPRSDFPRRFFFPAVFTSDYSSCVSAIASHDEDGLQDALASSKGSLLHPGRTREGLVVGGPFLTTMPCLRAARTCRRAGPSCRPQQAHCRS